jgi:hypothetical protein
VLGPFPDTWSSVEYAYTLVCLQSWGIRDQSLLHIHHLLSPLRQGEKILTVSVFICLSFSLTLFLSLLRLMAFTLPGSPSLYLLEVSMAGA